MDVGSWALVLDFYLSELMHVKTNCPYSSIMGLVSGLATTIMESDCGASECLTHCIAFQGPAYSRFRIDQSRSLGFASLEGSSRSESGICAFGCFHFHLY